MTETTDTHDETACGCGDTPMLARSIVDKLTDLAAHGFRHGAAEERAGEIGKEMPPDLAAHVAQLSTALFVLTRPENANAAIVLPHDMPEGLVEQLQQLVGDEVAKMGGRA